MCRAWSKWFLGGATRRLVVEMGLLDAGEKIEDRLRNKCTSAKLVASADSLADVKESAQTNESIYVVTHSYKPGDSSGLPDRKWEEVYLVVVAVQNVSQTGSSSLLRKQASVLLAEVISALDGWRCQPEFAGPLVSIPGPTPLVSTGWGYFPLAFQATSVMIGCLNEPELTY